MDLIYLLCGYEVMRLGHFYSFDNTIVVTKDQTSATRWHKTRSALIQQWTRKPSAFFVSRNEVFNRGTLDKQTRILNSKK